MAQVVIRSLNKKFDEVHAVKDVNLEIRDKEFMVFVGPSGCGKTTTLRMVAGLESITSGRILIDDKGINELPPMDRDIAMVFQNYALYPHMSVYDNMAFGLKMRKVDRGEIRKRVYEAADILGIRDYLGRKPRQLSGGQDAANTPCNSELTRPHPPPASRRTAPARSSRPRHRPPSASVSIRRAAF